ncbi:bestrophin family protein [Portibacter marinus]|uniref:bestrophin family protein n=1 Tax=Portibacter marinus TaxID=2898660 RepID=UPI001F42D467|nr:bestrophin family ion channel [Portibacter marinus]
MYVKRDISWKIIWSFAWKRVVFFIIYGIVVVYAYHFFEHQGVNVGIPFLPISVIGIAVAFYVGFKNNQSYDRFWEARKIWGGIVNYSRTWGNQVTSYVTDMYATEPVTREEIKNIRKCLIYRHIAWMNALRLQLRMPQSFSAKRSHMSSTVYKGRPGGEDWKRDVGPFLRNMEEVDELKQKKNPATQIIRMQGQHLKNLMRRRIIEDFRHMDMMHSLEEFYNLQGKCERINNTPLPRQYSFFSKVFIWIFILILPFGLVTEFSAVGHHYIWLTVPISVLISWIFFTMETVGDSSEDPFENFINDVPMTALCRTIEIDMREMLGETDLPPKIEAEDGVLM